MRYLPFHLPTLMVECSRSHKIQNTFVVKLIYICADNHFSDANKKGVFSVSPCGIKSEINSKYLVFP